MSDIKIRTVTENDAEQLLEIYAPYVEKTAITFEYEVPSVEEFKSRIKRTLKKYLYFAAESDGKIVGYAYAGEFKERAAYDWAVETYIYIKEDLKGAGIEKKLYSALKKALREQNILNLNACIAYTESDDEYLNGNSHGFHKHLGYRLVGRFTKCGFKFGKWYDMIWMEKHIGEHTGNPKKVKWFSE